MAVTKGQLAALARRAVQDVSTDTGVVFLANLAGQLLATNHEWRWLVRPPVSLAVVEDQPYVELPADMSRIIALRTLQTHGGHFSFTNLDRLAQLRQSAPVQSSIGEYHGAVTYAASTSGALVPRLEIYPTPSASLDPAMTLYYRAKFADITAETADSAELALPSFMDALYLQVFNAIVKGYEEQDVANVTVRAAQVLARNNPIYMGAKDADLMVMPDFGPLEGSQQGIHGQEMYVDSVVVGT